MKEEKLIVKHSIPVFLVFAIIMMIISLITHNISYVLGFILGYIINVVIFKIIVLTVDGILSFRKTSMIFVMFSFLIKMLIYGLGFYIAIKLPSIFNLFTVTVGYFVIKLSIFYYNYRIRKRGEGL